MSFPRLTLLALGLPLAAGGCAGAAVAGASYGADGVSLVESGKTTTDHFASMVSKKDCAFWRVLRNEKVCHDRAGDKDPYNVSYDTAERQPSEDGVAYTPPLRATAAAPPSSWTAEAYKSAPGPLPAPEPTAVAESAAPPPPVVDKPVAAHKPVKKKAKAHHHKPVKKPSPGQVASAP
jgi:hypothetical protein